MVWVVWQLVRFPDLLPPHSCKSGNLTAWQLKGSSLCRIEPQQKPSWCGGQQSGSPKCTHQPHYMHYFVSLMPVTWLTVFPGSTKLLLRAPIDWSFIWIRLQVHKMLLFFFLFSFFFLGREGGGWCLGSDGRYTGRSFLAAGQSVHPVLSQPFVLRPSCHALACLDIALP